MWLCICPSVDILRLFGHETSPRSPAPNMHPLAYGADMGVLVSLDAALHHIHRPRCELVNAHHRLYWENRLSLALSVSCTCAMLCSSNAVRYHYRSYAHGQPQPLCVDPVRRQYCSEDSLVGKATKKDAEPSNLAVVNFKSAIIQEIHAMFRSQLS